MLCSSATCPDPVGQPDVFSLVGAVGPDVGRAGAVDDPALVAAVVGGIRGAVEAAYVIGQSPPAIWTSVRYGLTLPSAVSPIDGGPLIGSDAATPLAPLGIPEPLLVLSEPLLSLSEDLGANASTLPQNAAYWGSAAGRRSTGVSAFEAAFGDLVLLHAAAQLSQYDASRSPAFLAALGATLAAHSDAASGGWGNLRPAAGPSAAPSDLGLSAMLLLVFVQGLCGATVQGGVTQTRILYATMGVNASATAVLPADWQNVRIHGLGGQADLVLFNSATADGVTSGGPGGPSGGAYVPWTVSALT